VSGDDLREAQRTGLWGVECWCGTGLIDDHRTPLYAATL
jgi:hypothetical protein